MFPYFSIFLNTNPPSDVLNGIYDMAHTLSVKYGHQITLYLNVYNFNSVQGNTTLFRCLFFLILLCADIIFFKYFFRWPYASDCFEKSQKTDFENVFCFP